MKYYWTFCAAAYISCKPTQPNKTVVITTEDTQSDTADLTLRAPLQLSFPLADSSAFSQVLGVDHDPIDHSAEGVLGRATCLDYVGRSFPHCYDEHDGSDYILDGSWTAMDAGSVNILAAAGGTVTETEDGHYDRCHADAESGDVSCDGHEMVANRVVVAHIADDGSVWRTRYLHMMSGSVAVAVGDVVERGAILGRVGSSGRSSFPHLHLQLERASTTAPDEWDVVDPYAGPHSQAETFWCEQGSEDGLPGPC